MFLKIDVRGWFQDELPHVCVISLLNRMHIYILTWDSNLKKTKVMRTEYVHRDRIPLDEDYKINEFKSFKYLVKC